MVRSIPLLISLLVSCSLHFSEAGVRKGFKKEVPSLEGLPERRGKIVHHRKAQEGTIEGGGHLGFYQKASKKSSKGGGKNGGSSGGSNGNTGGGTGIGSIVGGGGDSGSAAAVHVIDFMLIFDDFAYSKDDIDIGTSFAFTGRAATVNEVIGTASGSCVVASETDVDLTICDFYLNLYGDYGYGPVALSGTTDEVGGYMQVTGAGGDFPNSGYATVEFDPAGNPILYMLLTFQ